MQQWLNLVPTAGALLNLAAAMTNLAATIMNRRGTASDRVDIDGRRGDCYGSSKQAGPGQHLAPGHLSGTSEARRYGHSRGPARIRRSYQHP